MSELTLANISSIGFLHCKDKTINLIVCLSDQLFPLLVNVTKEAFETVRGHDAEMKLLAVKTHNHFLHNPS